MQEEQNPPVSMDRKHKLPANYVGLLHTNHPECWKLRLPEWVKHESMAKSGSDIRLLLSSFDRYIALEISKEWHHLFKMLRSHDRGQMKEEKYVPPQGCLYMAFIKPKDDKHCRRSQDGKIGYVVTPAERVEEIYEPQSISQFDKQVKQLSLKEEESLKVGGDVLFGGWHIPAGGSRGISGPFAWQYVKKYLKPTDEVHTFGLLDRGFVVIRDNKIFCIVVTAHNL